MRSAACEVTVCQTKRNRLNQSGTFFGVSSPLQTPCGLNSGFPFARAFAHCGWWPSMFLIAFFGATWSFNWTVGLWIDGPLGTMLRYATWVTWGTISCLAMGFCCIRSWRNLKCLGAGAVFRPRLWFEMSALAWHAMAIGFVATVILSRIDPSLFSAGMTSCRFFFVAFLATGIVGYGLLLARRQKPPWGRAFECVHYFLPLLAGGTLIVIASDHWLLPAVWPNRVIAMISGSLGIGIWASALLTMGRRMEELDTQVSSEPIHFRPEFN